MAKNTKIEWTDATWNPVRGCSRVSEGCRNCYAEKVAARFSEPGQPYHGLAEFRIIGKDTPQERSEAHWTGKVVFVPEHLNDPFRWKKPSKIFVNSMSDLFHEEIPAEWIGEIFEVMAKCPQHTFQILTKRPKRMKEAMLAGAGDHIAEKFKEEFGMPWPPPNIWLGVSVEDQKTAEERIPLLLETPAAIRWISYEPALGPISPGLLKGLDWVVMGGESGPRARPMNPTWVRDTRDACKAAKVPFYFKQWGEWMPRTDAVSVGARHCVWKDGVATFPKDWNVCRLHLQSGLYMERVGKGVAGHTIDDKEFREFPKVGK